MPGELEEEVQRSAKLIDAFLQLWIWEVRALATSQQRRKDLGDLPQPQLETSWSRVCISRDPNTLSSQAKWFSHIATCSQDCLVYCTRLVRRDRLLHQRGMQLRKTIQKVCWLLPWTLPGLWSKLPEADLASLRNCPWVTALLLLRLGSG